MRRSQSQPSTWTKWNEGAADRGHSLYENMRGVSVKVIRQEVLIRGDLSRHICCGDLKSPYWSFYCESFPTDSHGKKISDLLRASLLSKKLLWLYIRREKLGVFPIHFNTVCVWSQQHLVDIGGIAAQHTELHTEYFSNYQNINSPPVWWGYSFHYRLICQLSSQLI